jgi:hypothetical protein
MTTIYVGTGYKAFASGFLRERDGKDLSTVTIKATLVAELGTPPARDSASWKPVVVTPAGKGRVRLDLLVDDTFGEGDFELWAQPSDSPEIQPVRAGNEIYTLRPVV